MHTAQNEPPAPHCDAFCAAGAMQLPFTQQPVAQFVALQPAHCWFMQPPGQFWQSAPLFPHSVAEVPVRHTSCASQQPVGHEVESQVHVPLTHRCPC